MNEKHFILCLPNKKVPLPALERHIRHTDEIRKDLPLFWSKEKVVAQAYIRGAFNGCPVPSVSNNKLTQNLLSETLSELAWLAHILEWRK